MAADAGPTQHVVGRPGLTRRGRMPQATWTTTWESAGMSVTPIDKKDKHPDLRWLVQLARDKSTASRTALVTTITDLFFDQHRLLTEQDRRLMIDILWRLIRDVENSVRHALSERLSDQTTAPRSLIIALANDEIEVAQPILMRSEVLRDEELIEVVRYRTMEHQLAIAMRTPVTEPVSEALVDTENEKVITTLLKNNEAKISEETLAYLIEQATETEGYQEPLIARHDLTHQLARRLYWTVSAALREEIVERYDVDVTQLDETVEQTVQDIIADEMTAERAAAKDRDAVKSNSPDNGEWLLQLLRSGNVSTFVSMFSKVAKLRRNLVRRILFEPGGEGLAIACRAIEFDKHFFVTSFLLLRQGRLGDKQVDDGELNRAVRFFDQLEVATAQQLLRRWQRNPDYLNALRMIEELDPGAASQDEAEAASAS